MTEHVPPEATAAYNKVKLEITQEELARMSDSSLALWQANNTPAEAREHLAKYEWQRRISERQMKERFALDQKLAKENRWWGLGASIVGVIGTVLGVWLGKFVWVGHPATPPQESAAVSTAPIQPPASSNSATSAAKTTTLQSEKKPK